MRTIDEYDLERIMADQQMLVDLKPTKEELLYVESLKNPKAPATVRNNCDYYDWQYGCVLNDVCEPDKCEHFKTVVSKVLKVSPTGRGKNKKVKGVRYCGCGVPLGHRQRCCPKCKERRARKSMQKWRKKQRGKDESN